MLHHIVTVCHYNKKGSSFDPWSEIYSKSVSRQYLAYIAIWNHVHVLNLYRWQHIEIICPEQESHSY